MEYRIKKYREEKGISQVELSEKSGVSRATISALENGTLRATSTNTLKKIAKALGKKVSDIFLD